MPWITFKFNIFPWNVDIPYNELKRYVKVEFALRRRTVNENGDYTGFTNDEKKYRGRQCTEEDFESRDLSGSSANEYICIDWDGDEDKLFLMNNNEAAFVGGREATNILMSWFICDDNTGEFEDESIWDEMLDEGFYKKDVGWNYKRPDEDSCYPPEQIKGFIERFEP